MVVRRKTTKVNESFFATFVGEYVRVILDLTISETLETEEGVLNQSTPMAVEGFLLDYDDTYYYLGDGPNNVSQAIKKEKVSAVQVAQIEGPKTKYDILLDSLPDSPKKGDIN